MFSIITGAIIISLLHAVIPNHWLPVIAIGRKEGWTTAEVTSVTFRCAVAHGVSTVIIGVLLALLGAKLNNLLYFTNIIAPVVLIVLGLLFIYRHHHHKHFHITSDVQKKKTKNAIIATLVIAMFFSPCMEIEAYFLLAGAWAGWLVVFISILYIGVTTTGMVLLVRYAYKGVVKMNWHSLEHNAGIITGVTLVITGLITFFIH